MCQRAFTKGSALRVLMHRCNGKNVNAVEVSWLKADIENQHPRFHLNGLCSAVLIYLYWLGGKCMFGGVGYQRQERSKQQKWSRQSGPTAGSRGEHPSLTHFIMIAVKPHSKLKRKEKAKTSISQTTERETKPVVPYHNPLRWNELWMCDRD